MMIEGETDVTELQKDWTQGIDIDLENIQVKEITTENILVIENIEKILVNVIEIIQVIDIENILVIDIVEILEKEGEAVLQVGRDIEHLHGKDEDIHQMIDLEKDADILQMKDTDIHMIIDLGKEGIHLKTDIEEILQKEGIGNILQKGMIIKVKNPKRRTLLHQGK